MPNKNTQNKNDDKNFHAQMKRLENQRQKLGKQYQSLCKQEQAIKSSKQSKRHKTKALRDIRDKVKKMERENVEQMVLMMQLEAAYKREIDRRKRCPIPSNKCPICPLRPAQ